jgi:tetratricopeptide (TPR) repeat protein
MYRRTGKPDKSIECFDKALARDPGHQIALYNKGIILMHDLKDPEAALSVWQTLVGIHPDAKTPTGEPMIDLVEQLKRNIEKQPKGSQD